MPDREPIGVIGAGWVGLVTAACFADLGHDVHVRDIVAEKVESLSRGQVPIYEPGLSDLVVRNRERLHFTTEMGDVLANAQLLFCCVDTPPTYSGDADLSRVERVVEELGDSRDHAIVMKSTVPVGTGRSIRRRRDGLGYVSNPEFLKEGSAVRDFLEPDRVVVGADDDSSNAFGDRVAALYEPLDAPVVRTDVASAEMIKLASNAFLATKISFINEIANVSEELGADVAEVARGMGLDQRIGPQFLQAGIGYGGSCLVGEETVLVRRDGQARLVSLEQLFFELAIDAEGDAFSLVHVEPRDLEVLSWRENAAAPEFLPVAAVTRRPYSGDVIAVRTKMGRRVTCTADHPFIVTGPDGGAVSTKLASELCEEDWLPLALGSAQQGAAGREPLLLDVLEGREADGLAEQDVIVRPVASEIERVSAWSAPARATALSHRRGSRIRLYDVARAGALRLDEARTLGVSLDGASFGTARNGTYVPGNIVADERFWRVVGLYIAEGHCGVDGQRRRLQWSFHPTNEHDLVEEVAGYWGDLGVKATVARGTTTTNVQVSSRLLAGWLVDVLGLGRNCYEKRIPDLIWDRPEAEKRALLAGLWRGDGSWSKVNGGPSVTLEYGTASPDLADGILRLLGDVGIVASQKIGRTAKSTCDNYWIRVSGADQVQAARVRVTGLECRRYTGPVYSLEVPGSQTFVTTGGLVTHNCFPKDVSALKQLAGNTGYHFQLLTAVIEVNELQKRRTIQKLQKNLGALVGKEIALLGLAFKPNTDDMREATSLVLAGRLQSEGANVRVYDPVAADRAREVMPGARICPTALDALDGADGAVLVTEWPEFRELDWAGDVKSRMARPLVVDGRNFLDEGLMKDAGFTYEGIGRG
ncbi:MAG: nucleotide sugar dehydrogenase [Gaiellaceae bacterium]